MTKLAAVALGFFLCQGAGRAQSTTSSPPTQPSATAGAETGVIGANGSLAPEYTPQTTSERLRSYVMGAFGPAAIARAAVSAGFSQWEGNPKEWGGGAEAFGERFGNAFAEHIIRKTLESGSAALLHEDDRYFRSTDSGFFRRTRHAVVSVFVARNEVGQEHFSYSRVGGTLGASFISRIWQPPSENSAGDAAVSFGLTMVASMGWNVLKEFRPMSRNHGGH